MPLYSLFYYMEELGDLDPLSDTNLFVLHLVFMRRINRLTAVFTRMRRCADAALKICVNDRIDRAVKRGV